MQYIISLYCFIIPLLIEFHFSSVMQKPNSVRYSTLFVYNLHPLILLSPIIINYIFYTLFYALLTFFSSMALL